MSATAGRAANLGPVDLELVIAIDVSASMDAEERRLQRDGFAAALRDPQIIEAIRGGPHRQISIAVMEWGGERLQQVIVPWSLIDDEESAAAFADALAGRIPGRLARGTAIGDALGRASALFAENPFPGARRVVDLSGDGISNRGVPLAAARQSLVADGITINGLPIVYRKGGGDRLIAAETMENPEILIEYFEEQVIGGPGAFVQPVVSTERFGEAILRKLIREIRGTTTIASFDSAEFPVNTIGRSSQ